MLSIALSLSLLTTPMLTAKANTHNYRVKYAKTTINVRKRPKLKSKIVKVKYYNDPIKVVQKVNKKWSKILLNGEYYYVVSKYLSNKKMKYRRYKSPSNRAFKSYLSGSCITRNKSIAQGRLHRKYKLDYKTGVYMVGDRYCVALGSYYATKIGTKIDLVLSHNGRKHVLKCILADQKADRDTVNNHRVHKDGSVAEFVVNTSVLPRKARYIYGDVSYAGKQFRGKIVEIRIYK